MDGVQVLYGSAPGRALLKLLQKSHADRLAVAFLRSPLSRPMVGQYVRRYHIDLSQFTRQDFPTFRDFFVREKKDLSIDPTPGHLISPCDGLLSAFPLEADSSFSIKGSRYRLEDFLQGGDPALLRSYRSGLCLIFRLRPQDYHHYCYIDDGRQGPNHPVPGVLHSVRPLACETYPVYTLNRRSWTVLATRHFGPVAQVEIGALIVGGIVNPLENAPFRKGMEKGRFELAGSTIVLLFQKDRVVLRPQLLQALSRSEEVPVSLGEWIGLAGKGETE